MIPEGSLVKLDPTTLKRRIISINPDRTSFMLWTEIGSYLGDTCGAYSWVPFTEIGIVLKHLSFQTSTDPRILLRVMFPSGIGWLDSQDVEIL